MTLHAAFVAADYTPETSIPFGRLGICRFAPDGVHSPLMARLALFTDADTMVGVLVLDQNRVRPLVARELREVLSEATGAPPVNFAICATHTHNAPILVPWRTDDPPFTMLDRLREHVSRLACQAIAALQPIALRSGSTRVTGLAGCRRPVYRASDGREQVGTHGPREGRDFLRMESPDEDELRVLFALNADGKVCGGIANFPCHPVTMYPIALVSSDYPGELCQRLDERFNCRFLFITGPAGDQAPQAGRGPDECAAMGSALEKAVVNTQRDLTSCTDGPIRSDHRILSLPWRGVRADQIECAAAHLEAVARGERPPHLAPRLYGYAWHFRHQSPAVDDWLAREILGLWEVQRRSEVRRISEDVEVQALSLGGFRIVALPGEPFGSIGRALRDQYPALLVSEQSNGHCGYLPVDLEAFDHGGYECCTAQQSRLVPEAGPELLKAARQLLAAS